MKILAFALVAVCPFLPGGTPPEIMPLFTTVHSPVDTRNVMSELWLRRES
jgi:hypothetical protein